MKYIRKHKQSLTESNWFERFPVTALKQDIINLISSKAAQQELFINSSYSIPMKYYVSCGGYTIEELIADALSLSNRKHIPNAQTTGQPVSSLDGVYTYNNTRYDVEIKAYYDHPSARNRMFTRRQLEFLRKHKDSSLVVICKYKINEFPDSNKKTFLIEKINVLYGSEV